MKDINVMKDATVKQCTEDIITALEYGSRMLEDRVEEVFGNEKNGK